MNPERLPKFRPEQKKSQEDLFKHELIQKEFRNIFESSEYTLPENTKAIMILSAPPNEKGENFSDEKEGSPENVARIKLAIEVYKRIAAKKLGKDIKQLTDEDLRSEILPFIILNGETEQLPMMRKVAVDEFHFPLEKLQEMDCGRRGVANTKTQFEKFELDPHLSKLPHIALITNAYYAPRVVRTASANLSADTDFDVIGVPLKDLKFNVFRKTRGEVKKIIRYAEKGDMSKHP